MMLDFEDRLPAPPLSLTERVLVGLGVAMSLYGTAATLLTGARALIGVASALT